jgi:Zn-dependent protease
MDLGAILYGIATWLVPLAAAIILHEVSHGWVANAFGDPTAKRLGRLSLNPVRHVDPVGTIGLPMLLAVSGAPVFGWAKPVPVVAKRMRNPRVHMMLVALAGPAMNFLLALVAAVLLAMSARSLSPESAAAVFIVDNLRNFLLINIFLGVFNLLPVPPFDGGHVVEGLLPRRLARPYAGLARFSFPILILLLVVVPMVAPQANIIETVVVPPVRAMLHFYAAITGLA